MGQHFMMVTAVAAGRVRDDYGAMVSHALLTSLRSANPFTLFIRLRRSFPVVRSLTADAMGRLNHVA